MTQLTNQYSFRDLPSVDKLLSSPFFEALLSDYGHSLVSQTVRDMLNDLRQQIRHQAPAVLDEDPAGEPAAPRGWRQRHLEGNRSGRQLAGQGRAQRRNRLHAGPRGAAGFHRCALRGRPGRHA